MSRKLKSREMVWVALGLGVFPALAFPVVAQAQQSAEELETIVVTGSRASLTNALNKQRNADRVLSVVDSDALGNFPDNTAAEAMRRLSGVSVENDQGEGRYVVVRGFSPELSSIYLNGASIVAPEENRAVMLDGLPTDLLDSIEVSKSISADQDADSIGGRVDFRTLSSLDLNESMIRIKMDSAYNDLAESHSPKGSLTWAAKLNEHAGFVLGLTYAERNVISQNNETGFGWQQDEDTGHYFMNDDVELRYYDLDRKRAGVTLNFDYAPSDNTTLYARSLFNEYTDDEVRYKGEFKTLDPFEIGDSYASYSRFDNDQETRDRKEVRNISAFSVGGDTRFSSGWSSNYELSYSSAEQDDSDNVDVAYRKKYRFDRGPAGIVSWADPHKPDITLIGGFAPLSEYELDGIEFEKSLVQDEEVALRADFEKELSVIDKPSILKFGFKYRARQKDADFNIYTAEPAITLADFRTISPDHKFSSNYGSFLERRASRLLEQYFDPAQIDEEGSYAGDFVTDEDILALYGMVTIDYTDRLRVVAGLRFEQTDVNSSATQSINDVWTPVTMSKDYDFWAPSLSLKYDAGDDVVLRAAYSRTLARPGFSEFAPNAIINSLGDDRSIEYGNFDLKPYESDNIDLSIEHYMDQFSYISLGLFYKRIDNAIYPIASNNREINGIFYNDGIVTWENMDTSSIKGYEFNVQQQLGFLPGAFSNIYTSLNYTFNDADSKLPTGQKVPFRKMAKRVANFTLGYQDDKWDVRLASNYRDSYLDMIFGDGPAEAGMTDADNRYTDDHQQWDFTAKYNLSDDLVLNFEIINLNDEPEYYYWGNENNLSQYDEFGTTYAIGFRYSL